MSVNFDLTPIERQVAELVAQDLDNRQIAERLGFGVETAKTHVCHITRKAGVPRHQIASWLKLGGNGQEAEAAQDEQLTRDDVSEILLRIGLLAARHGRLDITRIVNTAAERIHQNGSERD